MNLLLHERTKRVLVGSFSTLFSKTLGFFSQIFITFLFARFLDPKHFGLWSIVNSFVLVLAMFDFGITGQGLRNALTKMTCDANCRDIKEEEKKFLSVFYLSCLFCVLLAFLGLILAPLIPWSAIFHYSNNSYLALICSVVFFFTFLRVPFVINTNGFFAYQEAHVRGIFESIEFLFLCISATVIVLLRLSFTSLIYVYYLAFFIGPVIALWGFCKRRKWKFRKIPLKEIINQAKPLARKSFFFWVYSTCSIAFFSVQPALIGYFIGLEEAGFFSIVQKYFTPLLGVHLTFLVPLWSAYTQAKELGDWDWIRKIFRKTLGLTALFFGFSVILFMFFHRSIIYFWTGKMVENPLLIALMGFWMCLFGFINCLSFFLNALNQIGRQAIFISLGLIGSLISSFTFGRKYGESGILLCFVVFSIPLLFSNCLQVSKIFRKQKRNAFF